MKAQRPGSILLVVVLLMTVLLALCTRMWRTTAYLVDIAIQKQEFLQKKWATQAILNCGIAACRTNFDAVMRFAKEQGGSATMILKSYQFDVPQLQAITPVITFQATNKDMLTLTARLQHNGQTVCALSCAVQRENVKHSSPYFQIRDWQVVYEKQLAGRK